MYTQMCGGPPGPNDQVPVENPAEQVQDSENVPVQTETVVEPGLVT